MSTTSDITTTTKTSREALHPLTVSVVVFLVVNTAVVAARAVSRHHLARLAFWWDDACVGVAWLALAAMAGVALAMVAVEVAASPRDAVVADLAEMQALARLIYAYLLLLTASFAATRLAILALYLRIFPAAARNNNNNNHRRLRACVWAVVGFVAAQYTAFTLVSVFACTPVRKFWTPLPLGQGAGATGTCIDRAAFYRALTPCNMAVDAALVALPLPTVWRLRGATRARKAALTAVFGLGVLALVASAIRLAMVNANQISERTSPSNTNALFIWVYVEPSVYLVAACLPTMHHIVAAATPRFISRWMAHRLSWTLPRRPGKPSSSSSSATSLGSSQEPLPGHHRHHHHHHGASASSPPCGPDDFHPYVGHHLDDDLEALGPQARVEAMVEELQAGGGGGRRLSKIEGIMVTQEVRVTHEDRIASVLGF